MIGLYKITNLINGHIYIGQSVDIERRWDEHRKYYCNPNGRSYNSALYRAFRKYGIENFQFQIVEECKQEALDTRERYWIDYYDAFHHGYNMTEGGDGKQTVDRKMIKRLWDMGLPTSEIRQKTGYGQTTITRVLHSFDNYSLEESVRRGAMKNCVVVQQFDLSGKFIAEYDSVKAASAKTGIGYCNIFYAMNGRQKSCGGFQWKRKAEAKTFGTYQPAYTGHGSIAVKQYTTSNELLQEFNSIKEASKATGVCETGISYACKGKQKTSGGFIWRYSNEEVS